MEAFAGDHKTSGGDKDKLEKLLAVMPIGPFLLLQVTITMLIRAFFVDFLLKISNHQIKSDY